MKTLGLIGGTTWVSTVDYYKYINQLTAERLGELNSAKILLYSVNYTQVKRLADAGDWDALAALFAQIARKLENAGADAVVLCANTTHIVADRIEPEINIPLLRITDATAAEIARQNLKRVALLGTKFTMENDFYKTCLSRRGIETVIPNEAERRVIHDAIFDELGKEIFSAATRARFLEIIENLRERDGAQGVILGCTEIPMLIKKQDCPLPSFDTTLIHAKYAVEFALQD